MCCRKVLLDKLNSFESINNYLSIILFLARSVCREKFAVVLTEVYMQIRNLMQFEVGGNILNSFYQPFPLKILTITICSVTPSWTLYLTRTELDHVYIPIEDNGCPVVSSTDLASYPIDTNIEKEWVDVSYDPRIPGLTITEKSQGRKNREKDDSKTKRWRSEERKNGIDMS